MVRWRLLMATACTQDKPHAVCPKCPCYDVHKCQMMNKIFRKKPKFGCLACPNREIIDGPILILVNRFLGIKHSEEPMREPYMLNSKPIIE